MHRHNRPGSVGDGPLDRLARNAGGIRVDIAEDGYGAGVHRRLGGGVEGERRHDHLVAVLDAQRAQGDGQRVRAVGDPDAVPYSKVSREVGLEGRDLRSEDVSARPGDGREPVGQAVVVPLEGACEQGDGHEARYPSRRLVEASKHGLARARLGPPLCASSP